MRRTGGLRTAAALCTGAVTAVLSLALCPGAAQAAAVTETLEIYSKTELAVPVSPAPGTVFTGNAELFDAAGSKIGTATGDCTVTAVSVAPAAVTSLCDVAFRIASLGTRSGDIFTSTVITTTTGLPSVLNYAVTGGTNDFRNVTGDAVGVLQKPPLGPIPAEFKFTFRLSQAA
ncbi:hypothetical protein ACTVZO_01240 [Streptomyces sp. IBSNAI002]|uniref:hypothetical protein n=1 Tax=Streptomyces sp. IBSNAI002 TaxID=3457500 RepID=UPI003FD24FFA